MSINVQSGDALYTSDTSLQVVPLQNIIPLLKTMNCPVTAAIQFGNVVFQKNPRSIKVAPRKEKLTQELAIWRTGEKLPRSSVVLTAPSPAATATTFEVATGTGPYYTADDVILCARTQEQMHVESVSVDTLTVQRAPATGATIAGQKPQAAMVAGDTIVRVSTSKKEAGSASAGRVVNVTPYQNYAQFFDKLFGVSLMADTTQFHDGARLTTEEMKAVADLAQDIEHAFLLGQPDTQLSSDGKMRYKMCGGIRWIEVYGVNRTIGGALTRAAFEEWLTAMLKIDNEKRVIACSAKVLAYIDSWADAKLISTDSNMSALGVNVTTYRSTLGEFTLFHHPILDEAYSPVSTFAFNPAYWTMLEKIPFEMKRDVQTRKDYTKENLIYGECSLKVEFPNTMGSLVDIR